ncbi:lytic transglycosylase domain-containing protein [Sphingomonas bacterium]|uniref:lytic transglycosylase domain-containing protein n=1 Tax=Sphingomonas bacterium TaxID=1895847 RepID=UPI001576DDF9|nr:lytic transglycosylase domain-containing protein [Sphingomonas bacterium]
MGVSSVLQAASGIQTAIASAARATGVDFSYLLGQAKLESGLNAGAHAGTSSASGLYQFVDQSWLSVVKKHGAEHGLGWAADAIGQGANGHLSVSDGATRSAILALRNDPGTASLMAAEYASDNKGVLEASLGRAATGTDLYMAHFMGPGGARQFLSTMATHPDASGAALFPAAARANRNVFFASDGSARSLSDIYSRFADKLGSAANGTLPTGTSIEAALADGSTVLSGAGESADDAVAWAQSTIGQLRTAAGNAGSLLRPTPDTARLAYMMLAQMSSR